jgi:Leucine-rich repeat (LRR) protein
MKILKLDDCKYLKDIPDALCLPNLESLSLMFTNIKILPKWLEKCPFIESIELGGCEYLEEIRGIPPNLKTLSAFGCKSLNSSSKSMLMNQVFLA